MRKVLDYRPKRVEIVWVDRHFMFMTDRCPAAVSVFFDIWTNRLATQVSVFSGRQRNKLTQMDGLTAGVDRPADRQTDSPLESPCSPMIQPWQLEGWT